MVKIKQNKIFKFWGWPPNIHPLSNGLMLSLFFIFKTFFIPFSLLVIYFGITYNCSNIYHKHVAIIKYNLSGTSIGFKNIASKIANELKL